MANKPCNKGCGNQIMWREPYVKGDRPLNLDGTPHTCQGVVPQAVAATPQTPKVRMSASSIAAEILEISSVMQTKILLDATETNDGKEKTEVKIIWTPEMIEGAWKYANTVRMQER